MKRIVLTLVFSGIALTAQTPPAPAPAPAQPAPPALPDLAPRARAMAQAASAMAQSVSMRLDRDRADYRRGTRALDDRKYDEAIGNFDGVIARKDTHADGALYWKAYALNKIGKRTEALAALDQLQKDYSQSAWLNDAKALRIEVQQSNGQPVSPESQSDEDLKLLAINGLMHSDPERAAPLLEKILSDPKASPRMKDRALFVIAQGKTPKAHESLMNIAKGGGNPDLQLRALEYLGMFPGAENELVQLYGSAQSTQIKEAILNALTTSRSGDRMMEIMRSEKDPKIRAMIVQRILWSKNDKRVEALLSFYSSETDLTVKRAALNALRSQNDAKLLVDLAHKETNPEMKKEIVRHLSTMKSKEATDYLMELLK